MLQTDGKILIANTTNYNAAVTNSLARLNADGSLDTSFVSRFLNGTFVEALSVDPDGKILVGGGFNSYDGASVPQSLIKLNADGTRDATFNAGGSGVSGSVFAIARQTDGKYVIGGSFGTYNGVLQFGTSTDKLAPADYTGDGKTDITFFRPSTGFWFILRSEDFSFLSFPFGTSGDIPAPADYDGDGKFDAAIFRPSNSTWFLKQSTAGIGIVTFGISGDVPVPNAFVP